MPISFTCTCGQHLRAEEEDAGRMTRCPTCGKESIIPDPRQAIQPAEANEPHIRPAPIAPPRSRVRKHNWDDDQDERPALVRRTSRKAVASFCMGLLLIGPGLFGVLLVYTFENIDSVPQQLALVGVGATFLAGLAAILIGTRGLRDISRSRGRLTGAGLAKTGIFLGWTFCFLIVSCGLMLPAVERVRDAAPRVQSANNMKQMAFAMYNYNDGEPGHLPENATIHSPDGKPLLSWRVALLPYLEQSSLYNQFHLDEPWDSPHNQTLIPLMPKVFAIPTTDPKKYQQGLTYYRVFLGPGTAFLPRDGKPPRLGTIPDPLSDTIMIVEAAEPVPWTKPDELVYDPDGPLPPLGGHHRSGGCNIAMFDGSVPASLTSAKSVRQRCAGPSPRTMDNPWAPTGNNERPNPSVVRPGRPR